MQIVDVPARFQSPFHAYPPHTRTNIESFFLDFAKRNIGIIKTHLNYLPILWTNNYVSYRNREKRADFRADPEIQQWLDQHGPALGPCFTVVQNDDGPYETLPPNIKVFGAGGTGHVAIPLLCDAHPRRGIPRQNRAFFTGQMNCGGPEAGVHGRSSWNPNGAGARIRRSMFKAFADAHDPEFVVSGKPGPNPQAEFEIGLSASIFGLAPRGYGKTSFRLYEAMQLGAIPVYIYDEPWLPFAKEIHWPAFCVLCPESEIAALPQKLKSMTQDEISRLQDNLDRIYPLYFTLEAASWQIIKILESQ
jgi:hypothetical protein